MMATRFIKTYKCNFYDKPVDKKCTCGHYVDLYRCGWCTFKEEVIKTKEVGDDRHRKV